MSFANHFFLLTSPTIFFSFDLQCFDSPGYDLPYYVRQFLMDRVSQYRKGKFGVTADVTAVPSYDHNDNLDDEHHPNFISSYERSSII